MSWTVCSSCGRSRNDFLRPPVRKPTLVWARITVWAVMPAQVVTPLETMESLDSETQLLAQNKLVMSFRLCRTAKLDLASAWKAQRSVSHPTTAPMSSTACPLASVFHGSQTCQSSNLSHWMWPTQDSALQPLSDRWHVTPVRCWTTQDHTFGDQRHLLLQQKRWQAC